MFDSVLNTPQVEIRNISVQNFLLLDKCICFWPVEKICSLRKISDKIGVGKIKELSKHIAFIVLWSK